MGTFLFWTILILIIAGMATKGISGGTSSKRRSRRVAGPEVSRHWEGKGNFDFEVVGESHYQAAIKSLVGEHGDHEPHFQATAALIPEDGNPYDDKAVRVDINGLTIGYMSRDDARGFRRRLGQKGLTGETTTCQALVVGGYLRRNGERVSYGVRLDIKPFW